MIATILLIANLIALIINGIGFMSFWWNLWAYFIEVLIYITFWGLMLLIAYIFSEC